MKEIILSINSIHNANIEIGLKIAELRTRAPQLETPFKVFTYESGALGRHKIVNEWICDKMTNWRMCMGLPAHLSKVACVDNSFIWQYCDKGRKNITEMHISQLKIYDKPKELGEFKKLGYMSEEDWLFALYPNTHCHYQAWAKRFEITRPPQSWQYVEEVPNG